MNQRCRSAAAVLTTTLVLSGLSAPPGTAGSAVETSAAAKQVRIIKPAKVGKAKVGMTVKQAMATGQFNKNVPNPPCGPIKLQPKQPFKNAYSVFVNDDDRIIEMNVTGTRPRTSHGLRLGSTYRQVKEAYGEGLSEPTEVGYLQWGVYAGVGEGADRRWIGFLFGEAFPDDGPLRGKDEVTLVGVTKGERPALMMDGC
ncbi:MAG: hypothetical protein WB471_06095 [Nocardioides sp.]